MTKANKLNPFGLTERQCEVIEALTRLHCNKLVARELGIGTRTVDTLSMQACKRMGVKTRMGAVLEWDRAIKRQIVKFNDKRPGVQA